MPKLTEYYVHLTADKNKSAESGDNNNGATDADFSEKK